MIITTRDDSGMNALQRAIDNAGGVSALAASLGVIQSAVSNWKLRGSVPAERCIAIEQATSGAVTRYELRPDVFGDAPINPASKGAA